MQVGLLIASRPWLSDGLSTGLRQHLGEILTFVFERDPPLDLHFPHEPGLSQDRFIMTHRYNIEDVGGTPAENEDGLCYEVYGIRIFRVSAI